MKKSIILIFLLLAVVLFSACGILSTDIPQNTIEPPTMETPVAPVVTETPTPTETPMPTPPILTAPYYLKVNLECNTVTVYATDEAGELVPFKAMVCSTGRATPTYGTYDLGGQGKWEWLGLFGDVYGHYCTQITGNILFHSVPYLERGNNASLEYWEFDQLVTACSLGCVRLQVIDAKWIFDNKEDIRSVEFYSDPEPGPLGKPIPPNIGDNVECRNWDPTDPDENNPWLG